MNKQQFDMNIQAADNNSLRIGAANRIVQFCRSCVTAIMRIVRKDGCGNYARMQKMFVTPREK